jgi:hypothetical protein
MTRIRVKICCIPPLAEARVAALLRGRRLARGHSRCFVLVLC